MLVIAGCLVKESVAPILPVLFLADALHDDEPGRWQRQARCWWPAWAAFGVYFVLRMALRQNHYYQLELGWAFVHNWPALATAAFASDLLPRVLAALGILDLVGWTVLLVLFWLAFRAARPARVLAAWVLLQTACYALIAHLSPAALPSHYLYLATVPAMGLVALALVGLFRLARQRRALPAVVLALLLPALGAAWLYGLHRIRQDERTHWQVASETLRRDFATLREVDLPAGTTIFLHMRPDETPGGGLWWGWEGFPLFSDVPVSIEVHHEAVWTLDQSRLPYALFNYTRAGGPRLVRLVR